MEEEYKAQYRTFYEVTGDHKKWYSEDCVNELQTQLEQKREDCYELSLQLRNVRAILQHTVNTIDCLKEEGKLPCKDCSKWTDVEDGVDNDDDYDDSDVFYEDL